MTRFRPCIDLHNGQVKQIVGSSLRDEGNVAVENHVSDKDASWFAELYRQDNLTDGHIILLGPGNEEAAQSALKVWPNAFHIGGGIDIDNAQFWLEAGAKKVIVTSWLFVEDELNWERLERLSSKIGRDRLVIDLSCKKSDGEWKIATNRWQTISKTALSKETLKRAENYCSEFLIHAVDAEGLQAGIDETLISFLAENCTIPVTYAGGAKSLEDLVTISRISDGKVDLTIGSALDIFGGKAVRYRDCVNWNLDSDFGTPFPKRYVGPTHHFQLVFNWCWELIKHLPALFKLRREYRKRPPNLEPRVVLFSDSLDEVNGIAISARLLVKAIRKQGHNATLLGVSAHTRNGRGIVEADGTILFPQVFSMEMVGYDESELSIPSLREIIRYFKRHKIDLVEIETPSSGGMMALVISKIVGIKVISHYRTDVYSYLQMLVANQPIVQLFAKTWVKVFSRLSSPVIVPSTHFKEKLQVDVGLKADQVALLPRGADLKNYSPQNREGKYWENHFKEQGSVRFSFVGRVSEEKELPFLEEVWRDYSATHPEAQLLIVGKGPYLEKMKSRCADLNSIRFTGVRHGTYLAGLYANADWFLFPSGTDTFGNVVVESLASGTPAIVSDSGGPRDIVEDQKSGMVIPFRDHQAWYNALVQAEEITVKKLETPWRAAAAERAQQFTLEKSARAFWDFYLHVLQKS